MVRKNDKQIKVIEMMDQSHSGMREKWGATFFRVSTTRLLKPPKHVPKLIMLKNLEKNS